MLAVGVQDEHLVQDPEVSLFTQAYRKYSNFSTESVAQTVVGNADFGRKITVTLARNGDLVSNMLLEVTLPCIHETAEDGDAVHWIKKVGLHLVKRAALHVGGQLIDQYTGQFSDLWHQLTLPAAKEAGFNQMIGNIEELYEPTVTRMYGGTPQYRVYVPLLFWFCNSKHTTSALPLLAMQYHDVKVTIDFETLDNLLLKSKEFGEGVNAIDDDAKPLDETADLNNLFTKFNSKVEVVPEKQKDDFKQAFQKLVEMVGPKYLAKTSIQDIADMLQTVEITKRASASDYTVNSGLDVTVYTEYVYLDQLERKQFAQQTHEYLITQVQESGVHCMLGGASAHRMELNFSHPVREIIFVAKLPNEVEPSEYGIQPGNPIATLPYWTSTIEEATLTANGNELFTKRHGSYFDCVQPYLHHSRTPGRGVCCYNFGLDAESATPNGALNFSRLDHCMLELKLQTGVDKADVYVYAVNYNVLRVMGGLAGIAYSS